MLFIQWNGYDMNERTDEYECILILYMIKIPHHQLNCVCVWYKSSMILSEILWMEIFVQWTTKKKIITSKFQSIQWNDAIKMPHINFDVIHYRCIHTWYFFCSVVANCLRHFLVYFSNSIDVSFCVRAPFFPSLTVYRVHFTHVIVWIHYFLLF